MPAYDKPLACLWPTSGQGLASLCPGDDPPLASILGKPVASPWPAFGQCVASRWPVPGQLLASLAKSVCLSVQSSRQPFQMRGLPVVGVVCRAAVLQGFIVRAHGVLRFTSTATTRQRAPAPN